MSLEKYAVLLGYFDKHLQLITKLYEEIVRVDVSVYEKQFVFALKVQQFYTALEDLFKQIAKAFENHIENVSQFHKEVLSRMRTEVPNIRPAVISNHSMVLLDKIRAFRHFIRHAYDCELSEKELELIQQKLIDEYHHLEKDLQRFRSYITTLLKGP
jgi:hypothetical protein